MKERSDIDEWTKNARRRVLILSLFALVGLFLFVPMVPRLALSTVTVTRWTKGEGEIRAVVGRGTPEWVPIGIISKHFQHAVIAAEDGRFYEHHGVDFGQIVQSAKYNWRRGRNARGGSTITQQVIKNAFLGRERSFFRKAREAVGAVLLETFFSKSEILEWYLNLVEFGDGVYGAKAAAEYYFSTKPELLNAAQSINLALVLPSPNGWSRGLRMRALTPFGHARFAQIAIAMRQLGFLTREQWIQAMTLGNFGRPIHGFEDLIAATARAGSSEPLPMPTPKQDEGRAPTVTEAPAGIGPGSTEDRLLDVPPSLEEGAAPPDE